MATYAELLIMFREASGRFDLATGAGVDTGGGKFINAGIQFIENRLFSNTEPVFEGPIDHVSGVLDLDDYTSVRDVYYIDEDGEYVTLTKIYLHDWLNLDTETKEDLETCTYWVNQGNVNNKSTMIQIYPEPEVDQEFYVRGFKSCANLSSGGDSNYWTVRHPMLVVHAALYQLEIFYRNFEGAKVWLGAVDEELRGIDHNKVEDTLYDKMEMRG